MTFPIAFCIAYLIFLCIMAHRSRSTTATFFYGIGIGVMIGTIIQLIGRGAV
jgi:hypothetical protein